MLRTVALMAWLPSLILPCRAQSVLPRFDPEIRTRVVTVSFSTMVISHEDAAVTASGLDTVFLRLQEGVTRFIDAVDRGTYSVFLQYDSSHAWRRMEGGLWLPVEAGERERASVRALMDGRMRVTSAEFVDYPHLAAPQSEMLRGMAGWLQFALPDSAVRIGDSWKGELRMSLTALERAKGDIAIPAVGEVATHMSTTVDSVWVHGVDTVAFLTLQGRFSPQSGGVAARVDGRTALARGSVSATMAWSSSWDAYVSGAVRSVIHVEWSQAGDRRPLSRIRIDVTTQFQVRV